EDSTTPLRETVPLFVATSTRVRLDSLSAASFVLTEVVRAASSTFCPAVLPVIAWQPASEKTVNITARSVFDGLISNSLYCRYLVYVQPRIRKRRTRIGMGIPRAQSIIHPTFPCWSFKI